MRLTSALLFLAFVSVVPLAHASSGPRVTRVRILKSAHRLELWQGDRLLTRHPVQIGPGGPGAKAREGDRVTPVGVYHVTMHQPSVYRTFLRLDYPNADDRARFAERKRRGDLAPDVRIGGDIGIHGPPQTLAEQDRRALADVDWTLGCIALSDEAIEDVARRVVDGTRVEIED